MRPKSPAHYLTVGHHWQAEGGPEKFIGCYFLLVCEQLQRVSGWRPLNRANLGLPSSPRWGQLSMLIKTQ